MQGLFMQYAADMLWAMGGDVRFTKSNEPKKQSKYRVEPTYPRWSDLINPKSKDEKEHQQFTKDDLKNHYKQLLAKRQKA